MCPLQDRSSVYAMCCSWVHFPSGEPWKQPHAVLLQVDVVCQDHQGPSLEVYQMEWEGREGNGQ